MAEKKVTADDLKDWYTPDQVFQHLVNRLGPMQAQAAIWKRVRDGMIRTFASRRSLRKGRYGAPEPILKPAVIEAGAWVKYESIPSQFWRGEAVFVISDRFSSDTVSCFDIRLDPAHVEREWPDITEPPVIEQNADATVADLRPPADALPVLGTKHAGGAPRKEFWDDLFIEMFERLWLGTFTPTRAADLERAMLDWASAKGFDLGETSVKAPARKLFAAYKREVKN
jgi:hypothetical protein